MMNEVREKVKEFLREALELNVEESEEEVRIIGIRHVSSGWIVEAEVIERDHKLPRHRVFEQKQYVVKLNNDLEISSYRQVKTEREREEECAEHAGHREGTS